MKYIFLVFGLVVGIFWSQIYEIGGQLINENVFSVTLPKFLHMEFLKTTHSTRHVYSKPIKTIQVAKVSKLSEAESNDLKKTSVSAGVKYPRVVMYGTSWCPYCKKARLFFKSNGIDYVEYDIEKNDLAKRMYDLLGGNGVPLILVDDMKLQGFNVQKFMALYSRR